MPAEHAILTTRAMGEADAYAIRNGRPGAVLMEAAARGAFEAIRTRWAARPAAVLCGPGNNGGDGWAAARMLHEAGWPVEVFSLVDRESLKGDAARAAAGWRGPVRPLAECDPARYGLLIDALFGAGLTRPLEGEAARLARESAASGAVIVSMDAPSGVDGDRARADGPAFRADLTVTFHRLKPVHVLQPGAAACGEIVLAGIGVPDGWENAADPCAEHNDPDLWTVPGLGLEANAHKHSRGRLVVLSGPAGATGAARLAAAAGLIGGAGFVTLLCPPGALGEASAASRSIVTRALEQGGFDGALANHRASAALLGPGAGLNGELRARVLAACASTTPLVLDADALTVFESDPDALFRVLHPACVLTPHAGEFDRLFPGLAGGALNKIEAARQAAKLSGAVIVFKGPDTVIAAPDGRVRVNTHASPRLATAGTGDVLAGLTASFMAQGADSFDSASAAVWIHGEAGRRLGPGAMVEDVLNRLPEALGMAGDIRKRRAVLLRLCRLSESRLG